MSLRSHVPLSTFDLVRYVADSTCGVLVVFSTCIMGEATMLRNQPQCPRLCLVPEEVGSICGCIRNSVYVGLYDDVMAPRRANGGACRCQVLERTWSPLKCLQTLSLQRAPPLAPFVEP